MDHELVLDQRLRGIRWQLSRAFGLVNGSSEFGRHSYGAKSSVDGQIRAGSFRRLRLPGLSPQWPATRSHDSGHGSSPPRPNQGFKNPFPYFTATSPLKRPFVVKLESRHRRESIVCRGYDDRRDDDVLSPVAVCGEL